MQMWHMGRSGGERCTYSSILWIIIISPHTSVKNSRFLFCSGEGVCVYLQQHLFPVAQAAYYNFLILILGLSACFKSCALHRIYTYKFVGGDKVFLNPINQTMTLVGKFLNLSVGSQRNKTGKRCRVFNVCREEAAYTDCSFPDQEDSALS